MLGRGAGLFPEDDDPRRVRRLATSLHRGGLRSFYHERDGTNSTKFEFEGRSGFGKTVNPTPGMSKTMFAAIFIMLIVLAPVWIPALISGGHALASRKRAALDSAS
ncbi:hypothetical protein [Mycobacterium talmoniae]|uniref:Uncharacterized protein n=1 Tax=Mycobacterium talmoniae TaxID=1858794 RepID=A0A2S8BEW7_9MYCO|nr:MULTISPECIES: hypothetical protein [Mycobacterium]PQM45227.1 hypothetical protein C1Y40_04615 [Mycobacterium talmoniae]TDH56120.1 hypothetical protein E2F47_08610 [Mycobacterium eburneum]